VETLSKKIFCCLIAFMAIVGFAQDAKAIRFGINSGLYRESIRTSCARTGEIGLRLGLYFDRTPNDLMYAAATRGISLCDIGCGCGGGQAVQQFAPAAAPCGGGCASAAPVPFARTCGAGHADYASAYAPVAYGGGSILPQQFVQAAPAAPKTEIYLLVLPDSFRSGLGQAQAPGQQYGQQFGQPQQQVAYYPSQGQAAAGPQYYGGPNGGGYAPQPQYYREGVEQGYQAGPVRGMW
jgi:hypothetical protein